MHKIIAFKPTVKTQDSKTQYSKNIISEKTQNFNESFKESITGAKNKRGIPLVKGKYEMLDY